jgi:trimethylamine:corrinoid methyltransferase-like protein
MQDNWLTKGPRGDFLKDKYTLDNMCELAFFPYRHGYGLYETRQWLRWIEDRLNMDDRAYALTQKIIKEFPNPLPPKDVADRMNAIVAKYDKVLQIGGYGVDVKGTGARF